MLAGAFSSSINSVAEPTLTLGYRLQRGWGVEAWLPITKFKHDVSLDGAVGVDQAHTDPPKSPVTLPVRRRVAAVCRAWYGLVSVSGERTTGPIAGTNLNVKDASGFVGQVGLDYFATSNVVAADRKLTHF